MGRKKKTGRYPDHLFEDEYKTLPSQGGVVRRAPPEFDPLPDVEPTPEATGCAPRPEAWPVFTHNVARGAYDIWGIGVVALFVAVGVGAIWYTGIDTLPTPAPVTATVPYVAPPPVVVVKPIEPAHKQPVKHAVAHKHVVHPHKVVRRVHDAYDPTKHHNGE